MAESPFTPEVPEQEPFFPQPRDQSEPFSQEELFAQASSLASEPEETVTPNTPETPQIDQSSLFNQALAFSQEPTGYEDFATNLIKLRDDPVGVSALGSILQTIQSGNLRDRYGKAYDYFLSEPGPIKAGEELKKAVDDGDILGASKAFLGGVGSLLTNYFNLAVGRSKEEAEAAGLSAASTNLIGKIKDPAKAVEALELGDVYTKKLDLGESISPEGQEPKMIVRSKSAEGYATQYNTGMNLAEAERYLKELQADKDKPVTESSLRVFFAKGADALPFVTTENIFLDNEQDPDQVGRRSALIQRINDTIMEDYYLPSLAGSVTGSVAGFSAIGAGSARLLGTKIPVGVGGKTISVPSRLSRIGTYALYGGGEAAEEVRPLSWEQELLNSFEKIASLGLSEKLGELAEEKLVTTALGAKVAGTALATAVPKLAPLYKNTAFIAGSTVGETISNQIDRIFAGQNPQQGFGEDFATALGVSLGMFGVSAIGGRRGSQAQAQQVLDSAKQDVGRAFEESISKIQKDSRFTFRQKDRQLKTFRDSLPTDEAKALFDVTKLKLGIDKTVAPQTAKVVAEEVEKAKGPALTSMLKVQIKKSKPETAVEVPTEVVTPGLLSREFLEKGLEDITSLEDMSAFLSRIENTMGRQPTPKELQSLRGLIEGRIKIDDLPASLVSPKSAVSVSAPLALPAPVGVEVKTAAEEAVKGKIIPELESALKTGSEGIQYQLDPNNKKILDYLEKEGRIVGEEVPGGEFFTIRGVRDAAGKGYGEFAKFDPLDAERESAEAELDASALSSDAKEEIRDQLYGDEGKTKKGIREIRAKFGGATVDTERAIKDIEKEKLFTPTQMAETEIAKKKATDEEAALERRVLEVPSVQLAEAQQALASAKVKKADLEKMQEDIVKQGAQRKLTEIDSEVETELAEEGYGRISKQKVLPKTLEKEESFDLPISIKGTAINKRWEALKDKPNTFLEDNPNALPIVFGIGGKLSDTELEYLKGIGAINDKNVPVLSALSAATIRFNQLAQASRGNPNWEIIEKSGGIDKVVSASANKFALFLREGKTGPQLDMEDIFFSHMKDLRRKALARAKYKAGSVAETSIDLPGNPVSLQAGILESNISEAEKQAEIEQTKENVPEKTLQIAQEAIAAARVEFEKTLKTAKEKALFEYYINNPEGPNGKKELEDAAKSLKLDAKSFKSDFARMASAFEENVQTQLDIANAKYAELTEAEAVDEIVKEPRTQISQAELSNAFTKFRKIDQAGLLLPQERAQFAGLIEKIQNERNKADLDKLIAALNGFELLKLGLTGKENPLDVLLEGLVSNLDNAIIPAGGKAAVMDKQSYDFYKTKIDEARTQYVKTLQTKDTQAMIDGAYKFRAELLRLDQLIRGVVNYANLGEKQKAEPITRAELRTEAGRRALASRAVDRAVSKRVERITKGAGIRKIDGDPTGLAREVDTDGSERAERGDESFPGASIRKSFRVTAQQEGFDFGSKRSQKVIERLGQKIVSNLDKYQKEHVIRNEWALENTPEHSMVNAFGPGRGKTRIGLATGSLYLPKGWKVFYVAPASVLRPDWKNGKIRHVVQKDADKMEIDIELRGGVYRPFQDSKFDKILVTTYDHIKEMEQFVDDKTLVIWDEFQFARNLKDGKLWAPVADRINSRIKAGRVLKVTGTPINSVLQLGAYSRELFEGKENVNLDEFLFRHGYELKPVRGGRAKEYRPISQSKDIKFSPEQLTKLKAAQVNAFNKKSWENLKTIDNQIGVDEKEAKRRLDSLVNTWAQRGSFASDAMLLKGVNFKAVPIQMTPELREELKSVAGSFGNTTIEDAEKGEALIGAQKFILERFKVPDAVKTALAEIDSGRKPVIWLDYVEGTKAFTGEFAEATASMIEAAILTERPGLKIAKLLGSDTNEKAIAASKFQNEEADLAIATRNSAGVGGELDDKRGPKNGGKPRSFIWMSLPLKADEFLQALFRGFRRNTASELNNVFLLTNHGADRYAQQSLLESLKIQEAFVDFGSFNQMEEIIAEAAKVPEVKPTRPVPQTAKAKAEKIKRAKQRATEPKFPIKQIAIEPVIDPKLKAKSDAPEDVYIPSNATPEQLGFIKEIDKDLKRLFGKAYDKGVFKFKSGKQEIEYFFKYGFTGAAPRHLIGSSNVYDEIVIDPEWVLKTIKAKATPEEYDQFLKEAVAHEIDHTAITRGARDRGGDESLRYSNIGNQVISLSLAPDVADIYSVMNNLSTKEKRLIKSAFESNPVQLGAEITRMLLQYAYRGSITEQLLKITPTARETIDKKLNKILKALDIDAKRDFSNWMGNAEEYLKAEEKKGVLPVSYLKNADEVIAVFDRLRTKSLMSAQIKATRVQAPKTATSSDLEAEYTINRENLERLESLKDLTKAEEAERKQLSARQRELFKQIEETRQKEAKKIEVPKKKQKIKVPQSYLPFMRMSSFEVTEQVADMDFKDVEQMLREAGVSANEADTKKAEVENKQKLVDQIVKYQVNPSVYASFPEGGEIRLNRSKTILDNNDLRIVRRLDMVLNDQEDQFLGEPVQSDMYGKYMTVGSLYAGIVKNQFSKNISSFEASLIQETAADLQGEDDSTIYLSDLRTGMLSTAESLVSVYGDETIPEAAMIPSGVKLEDEVEPTDPEPNTENQRGVFTVQFGAITPGSTTAGSAKEATGRFIFRTLGQRNISYKGTVYKQGSKSDGKILMSVLADEDPTFGKFATRRPNYASFPDVGTAEEEEKLRTRSGGTNLLASLMSYIPDQKIRERMLDSLVYRQISDKEQVEIAESYIRKVGIVKATQQFLADSLPMDIGRKTAVGFSLAPYFTRLAKDGDIDAQTTLEEIIKKNAEYGTIAGRAVQIWRVGPEVASVSPQVFGKVIQSQIEAATQARMTPYVGDIQETFREVYAADEIAANAFASTKETQDVLGQIEAIRKQTAAAKLKIADLDSAIGNYISQDSSSELQDIFGDIADIASLPTSADGEGDNLGFDPNMVNKLSQMLGKVIRLGFEKNPEIVQKEKLRTVMLLSPFFTQAKNREEVLRVFNHHFDAAYVVAANAFRDEQKAKLDELNKTAEEKEAELAGLKTGKVTRRRLTPPVVEVPKTRGEAKRRAKKVEQELDSETPVEVSDEPDSLMALTGATAKAIVKYADSIRNPKQKNALKEFAARLRRMMIARTKEKGGLQPPIDVGEQPVKPSAAQNLKELLAQYPDVEAFVNDVRSTLDDKYTPEEVEGLEPLIEEALGRPFTISNLSRVIRTLETIGGPNKSIHRLIRESRGDVAAFTNQLKEVLLESTDLSPTERARVEKYLSDGLAEMLAAKRREALEQMRDRLANRSEKKTKKYRSALDKLREATNLGVLRDAEIYSQIHTSLGLPELGPEERARLEDMINDLENHPKGRILNEKVEAIYEYVKLLVPVSFGELAVSYQTANYLQGLGTLGVNFVSATEGVIVDGWLAGLNASLKKTFGGPEQKLQALAIKMGREALKDAWWGKDIEQKGLARKYAMQIWKYGRFPTDSVILKEAGGMNIFEAMLRENEAAKAGKRGDQPATLIIRKPKVPAFAQPITDFMSAMIPSFLAKPVESFITTNENEIRVNLQAGWEPTSLVGKALAKVLPTKLIAEPTILRDLPIIGKFIGKLGKVGDIPAWPFNSFLGPYVMSSRIMATGDAYNKFGLKKMAEVIEAGYIVAKQNPFMSEEEFVAKVNELLNRTEDSITRATRLADIDTATYNLTPEQRLLRIEEILDQNRVQDEITKGIEERAKTRSLQGTFQDDFYGVVGLLAGSIDAFANTNWVPKAIFKFLRTGSNLVNEALNYTPIVSNWRMQRGIGRILAESAPRYYRPAPLPNTYEYDLLKGKMITGWSGVGLIATLVAMALHDDDENPWFFVHYKGPKDPQARKAYFAYGGKTRCIQIGKIGQPFAPFGVKLWDGPLFISWEALPPGFTGILLPSAIMAESLRYDDKSTAESVALSLGSAGLATTIGFVDLTALQGMRSILRLISPAPNAGADSLISDFATAMSGISAGFVVPYYPTIRDLESLYDGITGTPRSRARKDGFMNQLMSSFPVVAKFGKSDLDHLGGQISSQLLNNLPLARRFVSPGLDTAAYDNNPDPTEQATHDKLITLFAQHGRVITWNAGDLKEMALLELTVQASRGIPIDKSPYELLALNRELTNDEKYDWIEAAGPLIQAELAQYIPALEAAQDNAEFDYILSKTKVNKIKRAVLQEILRKEGLEKVMLP